MVELKKCRKKDIPQRFELDGQVGWEHNATVDYGYFHTFDELNLDGRPRKIHVFLPEDYKNSNERYPVIYMNDGQTAFFPNSPLHNNTWETDKVIDYLYSKGEIEPVIVVAVYPVDREYEYLSIDELHDFGRETVKSGGICEYADYLGDELKSFIDKNYRTIPDNRKTMIIGSSFGGIAAFYTACRRWDKFGTCAAMSPSFAYEYEFEDVTEDMNEHRFTKEIDSYLTKSDGKPRIWLDWGGLEPEEYNYCQEVLNCLIGEYNYEEGENIFYFKDENGDHSEAAWSFRLSIILKEFYNKDHKETR